VKTPQKILLILLGLLVFFVLIILTLELAGAEVAETLKENLGRYYHYVIIGIGLFVFASFFFRSKYMESKGGRIRARTYQRSLRKIREGLLEHYQNRLDQKLISRFPANLELNYSPENTESEFPLLDDRTQGSVYVKDELIDLFDKLGGRLLLVGEAGVGKTTLLLRLALKLLEREKPQIPVIIDFASWQFGFPSVQDWLYALLPERGFSKSITRQLLDENALIPLFDGLDELAEEKRKRCLEAIAEFGKEQNTNYVICSGPLGDGQTDKLPLRLQVMVKSLTIEQIKKSLSASGSLEANVILHAIHMDPLLREAIKTPVYLNIFQLLFDSLESWSEIGLDSRNLEGRKREIVEKFVRKSTSGFTRFSSTQVRKWLAFLAHRMTIHDLVRFELSDLQYDWSSYKKGQGCMGGCISGLVESLLMGLISFFFGFLFVAGLFRNLIGGLIFGIGGGLIIILVMSFVTGILGTVVIDEMKISTESAKAIGWKLKGTIQLLAISAINFTLFYGLKFGPTSTLGSVLLLFLVFALALIQVLILVNLFSKNRPYRKMARPYQRFNASMGALRFSILQHFHLRFLLYRKGLLPLRFVKLLKQATSNHLLESDGGSWRFRHRILQDYLADYWEMNYG
jgi:hypothetical protein